MDWQTGDDALQEYVKERQATALRNYENDPDLLEEHVGQEDSFRSGGYGQRQISELLQNAVDALTKSKTSGIIEFRIADGALYCANEGVPFTEKGVRSVCAAFLSSKREEDLIGRFGLGFKSVLGVSDHPQIYSRSVSIEFNAPGTEELFAGIPVPNGRLPLMRVPSLADAHAAAAADPHLAELMTWATTVVKLPLRRDGDRIRSELSTFTTQSLLFMKWVSALNVTMQGADRSLATSSHRREGDLASGEVILHSPDSKPATWLYAERVHEPSEDVLATLPATIARQKLTVSYAVPKAGQSSLGEVWAWFPLQDKTTARGIFNAPWQVNDDRTTLIRSPQTGRTTPLNESMLEICAGLFLEVVARASTKADPSAHLDLFPARGKESRGVADTYLTSAIQKGARQRKLIPDADGKLRDRSEFTGVPMLDAPVIPIATVSKWQSVVRRRSIPHASAFTNGHERFSRLRSLFRDEDKVSSRWEQPVADWLGEAAAVRTTAAVSAACEIYFELRAAGFPPHDIDHAQIIPTSSGGFATPGQAKSVLIPREGQPVPDGITLVDMALLDEKSVSLLTRLGVGEISKDQVARAVGSGASRSWGDADWQRLWQTLSAASPATAQEILTATRARGLEVLVQDSGEQWRPAAEILIDSRIVADLPHRTASAEISRRPDLLRAAGCVEGPQTDYPIWREPVYEDYRGSATKAIANAVRESGHTARALVIPEDPGVGPLQLLVELDGNNGALARWTELVLRVMPSKTRMIGVPLNGTGQVGDVPVASPEWWAVATHGRVVTSRGIVRVPTAVGRTLAEYGDFLPVLGAELDYIVDAPKRLQSVADSALKLFLNRQPGDEITDENAARVTELLAETTRRELIGPDTEIPAVLSGRLTRAHTIDVVITSSKEDADLLDEHGIAHVPAVDDASEVLIEAWGLRSSSDALARSLEVRESGGDQLVTDRYPTLASRVSVPIARIMLRPCSAIIRRSETASGVVERREMSARIDDVVAVDDALDDIAILQHLSSRLGLGLARGDIDSVLADDEALRQNELVQRCRAAAHDRDRLLLLFGTKTLKAALPQGLLDAVEEKTGSQTPDQIAELYWKVRGFDSLWHLREELRARGLAVPSSWSGSPQAQAFVARLGFATGYAGTKEIRPPALHQVHGRVELKPLHDFQETLARDIRLHVLDPGADGQSQRGLLYLPTGAGKTRVTVEAIVRMFTDDELAGPVLWIAQSQELCEQAVQTWTEVWRAIGDERVLDISRFWGDYEVDESREELQVVIATDDKIYARIDKDSRAYPWLADATLAVIDEAHRAGTQTYTAILRWLGIVAGRGQASARTARPLLGLTATPYRGRNAELNRLFVERFGSKQLKALDPDDPIGELRRKEVLAEVDHKILDGSIVRATEADLLGFRQMRDVTKTMLDRIGQDMTRTSTLVNHIRSLDPKWPVLAFAASVSSAHTIAALLTLQGTRAAAVDGSMRPQERRRIIEDFRSGRIQVLVNCDLLTQGFDAPEVRALYIARPTFSPNRYHQMIGRGLRGPKNGGTERCLIVNVADTFEEFGEDLAFTEFNYLWETR
ncbi:hypothetical protein GCM10009750_12630 [Agromyces salentinus]|uniref:DEAD/DEAH box helicase n=2 Tax=Agromyces salentinus TaxID=269421 RepID=A0ABN2MKZ9_9MICO